MTCDTESYTKIVMEAVREVFGFVSVFHDDDESVFRNLDNCSPLTVSDSIFVASANCNHWSAFTEMNFLCASDAFAVVVEWN